MMFTVLISNIIMMFSHVFAPNHVHDSDDCLICCRSASYNQKALEYYPLEIDNPGRVIVGLLPLSELLVFNVQYFEFVRLLTFKLSYRYLTEEDVVVGERYSIAVSLPGVDASAIKSKRSIVMHPTDDHNAIVLLGRMSLEVLLYTMHRTDCRITDHDIAADRLSRPCSYVFL